MVRLKAERLGEARPGGGGAGQGPWGKLSRGGAPRQGPSKELQVWVPRRPSVGDQGVS